MDAAVFYEMLVPILITLYHVISQKITTTEIHSVYVYKAWQLKFCHYYAPMQQVILNVTYANVKWQCMLKNNLSLWSSPQVPILQTVLQTQSLDRKLSLHRSTAPSIKPSFRTFHMHYAHMLGGHSDFTVPQHIGVDQWNGYLSESSLQMETVNFFYWNFSAFYEIIIVADYLHHPCCPEYGTSVLWM